MTEFEKRMYAVIKKLWWKSDILAPIWSYKDTQTDEQVIEAIDDRLEDYKWFHERNPKLDDVECSPVPMPELGRNKIKIEPNNNPILC